MSIKRLCKLILTILISGVFGICANAAQNIEGTLIKPVSKSGVLTLQNRDGVKTVSLSKSARVQRGQVKMQPKEIAPTELHCGDQVVAALNSKGEAFFVKASFDFVRGELVKRDDNKLFIAGEGFSVSRNVRVFSLTGSVGKVGDLKPGSTLACVVNPVSREVWEVFQTSQAPSAASDQPAKPRITSVQYSPLGEIKCGDTVTVEIKGTAGGKASFEIRGLTALVPMQEVSAGYYRATIVPGSSVASAPLVAYLSLTSGMAAPVQAGRLVNVSGKPNGATESSAATERLVLVPKSPKQDDQKQEPEVQKVISIDAPKPQIKVPVRDLAKPRKAPQMEQIVLKYPQNGAVLKSSLTVVGQASPESKVCVMITYSNGRVGILKLAGVVVKQTIAVGKDGVFRLNPIPLDGALATRGLVFSIKAYYVGKDNHGTVVSVVTGGGN